MGSSFMYVPVHGYAYRGYAWLMSVLSSRTLTQIRTTIMSTQRLAPHVY
jgi:hypothetical protein